MTNDAGSVELLYTTHNRLDFTRASFEALLENTNWDLVSRLLVVDDRSTDGTLEFMTAATRTLPVPSSLVSVRTGGPSNSMNVAIDRSAAAVLAKIDNDVIVCPQWLDLMLDVLQRYPSVTALGMEPGFGKPLAPLDTPRSAELGRWIGGVGLIRTSVFAHGRRPAPVDRWFGWTLFQKRYVKAAWVSPDLPVFLLDHLDFEPWLSLSQRYIANGWQRAWPDRYPPAMSAYWEWWAPDWAPMFA